jgi:hypothetical protein
MKQKDVVRKAIHFDDPPRMPKFFFDNSRDTDVLKIVVEKWNFGENGARSEWGFEWDKPEDDATDMGVPKISPLRDWGEYDRYVRELAPDPCDESRFDGLNEVETGDRYVLGSLFLSGFTVMTMLRGFDSLLMDLYDSPDKVRKLEEIVFGTENKIIEQMKALGFDCVAFFDDWGSQQSMMISPEMWKSYFLPRYNEQFDLVHRLGMDVFFHTCGNVYPIIDDLIESGVDILNLGNAELNGFDRIRDEFRGRVCFCQSINYQTTGISGTKEEIMAEGRMIIDTFGTEHGGLIPMLLDYEAMGWKPKDPRNTEYQIEALCGG